MSRISKNNHEQDPAKLEPERALVHKLVDSSKAQRTKAIERLKSWINARTLNSTSFFTYDDLIKIWKGLYYNMWMADKPILQVVFILIDILFKGRGRIRPQISPLTFLKIFLLEMIYSGRSQHSEPSFSCQYFSHYT